MNDVDTVKLGREMEIDIAINLTGHTENARGRIFSLRVAPVQINFLGFSPHFTKIPGKFM